MLGLLAAMLGGFPFYSESKYFPVRYSRLKGKLPRWAGICFLVLSLALYVVQMGVVAGLLTGFLAITLAYLLLAFIFHLPSPYFRVFWGAMTVFLLIDLIF